jgi:hypothetical protein
VNTILTKTTAVVTATVSSDTVANLISGLSNATSSDALNLTTTGASASASQLNTLDNKTSVNVNASSITDITSSTISDVKTLVTNATTAGISSTWNVTISNTTLSAADINDVNNGTSGIIDISAATTISSSTTADVLKIVNNTGATFTTSSNYAVTLSDTASIANANTILGDTSAVVTATIASNTLANLNSGLSNATSSDALTLSITDTSVNASDLTALDGKTSVDINVSSVTSISGTDTELKALYDSSTNFIGLGNENVSITNSGTHDVSDILDIDTTGVLNMSSGNDTLNFDSLSEFNTFRTDYSDIVDAGGTDTISFGSSAISGDLDFTNLSEFENLNLSSVADNITISGDEAANINAKGGNDTMTLDFSNIDNFTLDGDSGDDTAKVNGTSNDIGSTDSVFGHAASFDNIETLDLTGLNLTSDNNATEFEFTDSLIESWTDGTNDLTLKLTSAQADKIKFTDVGADNAPGGGDDTLYDGNANSVSDGSTYDLGNTQLTIDLLP